MKFKALNEKLINEDDTKVDDILRQEADLVTDNEGDIEAALTKALNVAKRQKGHGADEYVNILLIGEAGVGKTARVKSWAAKNGVNLFSAKAGNLDLGDLGGALTPGEKEYDGVNLKRAIKLASAQFDALDRPNSVLFLDEFNRASGDVRGTLLTLINNHTLEDADAPTGEREFKNMMFTIAAINPTEYSQFTDALDPAELDRFFTVYVTADKKKTLDYLRDLYTREIQNEKDPQERLAIQGRLALAEKILTDKKFSFDSSKDRAQAGADAHMCTPRSFTRALEYCDGTKDDLLFIWNNMCNPAKKVVVEDILENYTDVQDKANDALAVSGDDIIAKKKKSAADKLASYRANH